MLNTIWPSIKKLSTFSFVTCTEDGRLAFKRIPKRVCFACLNSKHHFYSVRMVFFVSTSPYSFTNLGIRFACMEFGEDTKESIAYVLPWNNGEWECLTQTSRRKYLLLSFVTKSLYKKVTSDTVNNSVHVNIRHVDDLKFIHSSQGSD